MTNKYIIKLLKERVKQAGTQVALAREWGISAVYLSDVINGHRPPGKKILRPLGLKKETVIS